jgi:hypothetical protein
VTAARNEFAEGAMRLMHGLSRRFWYYHYKQAADLPEMPRLHGAVANADSFLEHGDRFGRGLRCDIDGGFSSCSKTASNCFKASLKVAAKIGVEAVF